MAQTQTALKEEVAPLSWIDYSTRYYAKDLAAFKKVLGEKKPQLSFSDIDVAKFKSAYLQTALFEPSYFVMELFLEGALLAGVRYYDPLNYKKYCTAVWNTVFVQPKEGVSKKQPHLLLAVLPEWNKESLLLLEGACRSFLPLWMSAYGNLVGGRHSGVVVVSKLGTDSDLLENPGGILPAEVIETYQRGFQEMSKAYL
jgi:hypothetical protein